MSKAGLKVNLNIREIHQVLCKKCREKIRKMVRDKISEQLVDQVIDGEVDT